VDDLANNATNAVTTGTGVDAVEATISAHLDKRELREAATCALHAYGRPIWAYLLGILRDRDMADEAFCEFSEQLWKGIGNFRRECTFRAWAYKLAWCSAVHSMKDPYRKRGRRLESQELSQLVDSIRSATPLHLQTTLKDRVEVLRKSLEPEERSLLILRVDRQLSWTEIASVLGDGANEAALRKRYERVKKKLKDLAEQAGLLTSTKKES
jgi:RNA polymerase sigma-70 factor, ECF subfamily